MRNSNWLKKFLDWCIVIGEKLGKVISAFSWVEKVYKNEMVREIVGKIWTLL